MSIYRIIDLQHQFSAWCAARALPRVALKNKEVLAAIEAAGLQQYVGDPELLPDPDTMDVWHRDKCERVQNALAAGGHERAYGVAAKIVNIYFKALYCHPGACDHPKIAALHPPIDSEIVNGISKFGPGDDALWRGVRWTSLTSAKYQSLIMDIRLRAQGRPLWHVEQLWRGRTA